MNDTNLTINRFSWRRVAMVARFFYPMLRSQIIFFPIVAFAFSLWINLMPDSFILKDMITGFMLLGITLMFWWASGKFAGPNRQCETMLPALWSEKALFVVVYSLAIVPLLLFVPQMIVDYAASLIDGCPLPLFEVGDNNIVIAGKEIGLNSFDVYFSVTTCMYFACRSAKSTFVKSAVWSLVATIAWGLVIGIIFIVVLASEAYANVESLSGLSGSEVIDRLGIGNSIESFYWLSVAYSVLMVFLTVRSFKKIQM